MHSFFGSDVVSCWPNRSSIFSQSLDYPPWTLWMEMVTSHTELNWTSVQDTTWSSSPQGTFKQESIYDKLPEIWSSPQTRTDLLIHCYKATSTFFAPKNKLKDSWTFMELVAFQRVHGFSLCLAPLLFLSAAPSGSRLVTTEPWAGAGLWKQGGFRVAWWMWEDKFESGFGKSEREESLLSLPHFPFIVPAYRSWVTTWWYWMQHYMSCILLHPIVNKDLFLDDSKSVAWGQWGKCKGNEPSWNPDGRGWRAMPKELQHNERDGTTTSTTTAATAATTTTAVGSFFFELAMFIYVCQHVVSFSIERGGLHPLTIEFLH